MMKPRSMASPLHIGGQDNDRRPIRHDLAHSLAESRGVEAHHNDGVRTHGSGVLHHPVEGVAACLFKHLRVFYDLPAAERAYARHDVTTKAPATHHQAKYLAFDLRHPVTCYILRSN